MTSADRLGLPADLQRAVDFHGHVCPGLVIGYRAAKAAAHALQVETSGDEELILIAENDSCSVDAFQVLLSTTFGKGNLCLLYTSDAADDLLCVDLGGRRLIKKKNKKKIKNKK